MVSFYGGASIYGKSGSGGGSSDYNDLSNRPIKNLSGTAILDTLDYGNYSLIGSYLYDENDTELKEVPQKILIAVTKDQITQEKVVTFDYISSGVVYSKIITYHEDGSYSASDYGHMPGSSNLLFIDEEDLTNSNNDNLLIIQD